MASFTFNVAFGTIIKRVSDGADLRMLLLKETAAPAVLRDLDTVAAVLADANTTEADFTNYARQTLANTSVIVDDTADEARADADDVLFANSGGATNNTGVAAIIYENVDDTDANAIPLVYFDVSFTTDGNDVTIQFPPSGFHKTIEVV